MDYIRGNEAEYDVWETLGSEGWNWDAMYPYFKRSENFTTPTPEQTAIGISFEEQFHGEDGFLTTGFPYGIENRSSFYYDYRDAWAEIGIARNPDVNSGVINGFNVFPLTIDRDAATRESSARAYYQPVDSRPNLKIIQGTVSRIIWHDCNDESLRASGVEYIELSGEISQVGIAKEVIVSAGALRSPLVLEASGIGNPA